MSESMRNPDGTMKKGFSANPRGRPPRSRNLITLFNEKRDEKVAIRVDGKVVKMSRLEAFVTNIWNKAVELDPKAVLQVVGIMRASGQLSPPPGEISEIDDDSAAVLNALVSRLAGSGKADDDK